MHGLACTEENITATLPRFVLKEQSRPSLHCTAALVRKTALFNPTFLHFGAGLLIWARQECSDTDTSININDHVCMHILVNRVYIFMHANARVFKTIINIFWGWKILRWCYDSSIWYHFPRLILHDRLWSHPPMKGLMGAFVTSNRMCRLNTCTKSHDAPPQEERGRRTGLRSSTVPLVAEFSGGDLSHHSRLLQNIWRRSEGQQLVTGSSCRRQVCALAITATVEDSNDS